MQQLLPEQRAGGQRARSQRARSQRARKSESQKKVRCWPWIVLTRMGVVGSSTTSTMVYNEGHDHGRSSTLRCNVMVVVVADGIGVVRIRCGYVHDSASRRLGDLELNLEHYGVELAKFGERVAVRTQRSFLQDLSYRSCRRGGILVSYNVFLMGSTQIVQWFVFPSSERIFLHPSRRMACGGRRSSSFFGSSRVTRCIAEPMQPACAKELRGARYRKYYYRKHWTTCHATWGGGIHGECCHSLRIRIVPVMACFIRESLCCTRLSM
jgi:hypothetical protein